MLRIAHYVIMPACNTFCMFIYNFVLWYPCLFVNTVVTIKNISICANNMLSWFVCTLCYIRSRLAKTY